MRPDAHIAMRRALELGPAYCPPDLFAGTVPAIVSALMVHNATIADGRRSALAETFPRTRQLLGSREFDSFAELHLDNEAVLSRPLSSIGCGFPELLTGAARGLARLEWAWLECHGAADARAIGLSDLAGMTATSAAALRIALHPATRIVSGFDEAEPTCFDSIVVGTGAVLLTRPESDVKLAHASLMVADLVQLLDLSRSLGDLLECDADGATILLRDGALTLAGGAEQ